ncbi:MAG: AAA family ATPase [Pirellulales bacterium]
MSYDRHDDDDSQQPVIPCGFLKLDEMIGETQTRWLWPDKVPLGYVTIVAGEASSGKSLLAAEIAARVSSGAGWSDAAGEKPSGSVLIAHANQHENLVLKGRLLAAGADPSRVAVVNRDVFERDISGDDEEDLLPAPAEASLCALEGALVQIRDASLVVIDHLLAWLGRSRLRPDELTEVFKRLADMAARYRVALVVLWRLEKGGRAAQTRALDALAGAAPVVWFVANDTYSSQSRSAVCAQNRLGAQSEDLAFRVTGDRLVWQEAVRQVSADDLVATRTADRHERRQAGQWLLDLLSQGPIEAKQLWDEARQCGLAERTLRRASAELGLRPTKDGKRNVWLWGVGSESGDVGPTAAGVMAELDGLQDKETRRQGDKEMSGAAPHVGTTAQNVAALLPVGSLADAGAAAQVDSASEQNVAALPAAGRLADSAVVRVELRPDAPPCVAALPAVGSLAGVGGAAQDVSASEQNVAALPPVGSLAGVREAAEEVSAGDKKVIDLVCGGAESDEEEQKLLAEAIAAAAASDGGGDRAEQSASASDRKRRLRRERRAIERTLRICRDG